MTRTSESLATQLRIAAEIGLKQEAAMNTTRHKISATRSGSHPTMGDWDQDYTITFTYLPGSAPIIHPADNACPGWSAEIEFVSIDPDAGDHGAFSDIAQGWLIEWAKEWLDEHFDECADLAVTDRQPDPDAARDAAIDDRLEREAYIK